VLWEAVFLLLVLKIPIVYMCLVVWWAIRKEPSDEQPATVAAVTDTPSPPQPPTAPGPIRPRSPRGPSRKHRDRAQRQRTAPRHVTAHGESRR
jgi:hypothetical protein